MTLTPAREPNPAIIFDSINAYQKSASLKAAIELNVFTLIAQGNRTSGAVAKAAGASDRGMRILCDYLVIIGFLSKDTSKNPAEYSLTIDSATFLDRNSPAYFGDTVHFMLDPRLIAAYLDLTQVVRTGRTTLPEEGTISHDNPVWVEFAKWMAPMVFPSAQEIAELVAGDGAVEVLDIAAGHGLFGVAIAQRNPNARVTALDWANVLAVATENAAKFGVGNRHSILPGDAFRVEFGGPYGIVLATNFFHHFDPPTCEKLMKKMLAALAPGGRCVTLEFVPNDDRVSPPTAAGFSMMMLGTTPSGDAYTFAEYDVMFRNAGFASSQLHALKRAPQSVILSNKA